ncbi:MAG: hypothetical protein KYX64_12810 [Sphingopyxis sp.]|nr:hypothetical protein [Sphingopyxis sp.]
MSIVTPDLIRGPWSDRSFGAAFLFRAKLISHRSGPDSAGPWMPKQVQHDETGKMGVPRPTPPKSKKLRFPTLFLELSLFAMTIATPSVIARRHVPGSARRGSETRGVRAVTFVTFRTKGHSRRGIESRHRPADRTLASCIAARFA